MSSHPLDQIVARGQCMGCGFCAATFSASDTTHVKIVFDAEKGLYRPQVEDWQGGDPGAFLCPGARMDMKTLSQQVFGAQPADPIMGLCLKVRAVCSTDKNERRRAASGGAVPAILRYLFDRDLIDAAYSVATSPGERDGAGRILRSKDEISLIHGSVYHPADFGKELKTLLQEKSRFAFVGLPCEVAALRMLMADDPSLRARCVAAIAIFCGGINRFKGIAYYLERFGLREDDIAAIRYREGDWPGMIAVELRNGGPKRLIPRIRGNSRWAVMRYMAAFQGAWMLKRCRICPDQIGDFADIAVGDPHLPRFRGVDREAAGFSALLTRTLRGEELIASMIADDILREEKMTRDDLVASQGYTLDNRRQAQIYARMENRLGGVAPELATYDALKEKVALRHSLNAFLDLAKLRIPDTRLVRVLWPFWQIFEYLFLRFPLLFLGNRLMKLLRNR